MTFEEHPLEPFLPTNANMDIREKVLQSTRITEFQRKVYLELLNVPAGETITYGELARRIGCRSPRAVGGALHRNPFAPDVPCHRVISSDGSIGGYAFGPEKKRELLEHEREFRILREPLA